jgi:cation:H+ antiporter
MEKSLDHFVSQLNWPLLIAMIIVSLALLGKGANWLVEQAVKLSSQSGIPKVVIGATIVSLGTTAPEATVSVLAAIQGKPGLALGNAVGSIICDTGLILGVACLISPLPLDRSVVTRQGWLQFFAGILLVLGCFPGSWQTAVSEGGHLPRWVGFGFLGLLVIYMWHTVRQARREGASDKKPQIITESYALLLGSLLGAVGLVVSASYLLIPAISEAALRMNVPESIVAATMVAFGTSLPELVTAVTSAWRGHGELAVGNIIGADILNVLFVAGAAAAVTSGGLPAPSHFFTLYFPSMLFILVVFRLGIFFCKGHLTRPFGVVLVFTYLTVTVMGYLD